MTCKLLCAVVTTAGFLASSGAAAVSGTFNMSGIVNATTTAITWNSDVTGNAANYFTLTTPTGNFVVIPSGSQETVQNLNNGTEPVGMYFSDQPFIAFPNPSGNGLPALLINYVFPGIYSSAGCTAMPPAPGQTCTLPSSPFSFVNNAAVQATVTWVLSGETSDHLSTWTGIFTAQFTVPFQTVLAELSGSGTVSNSYSATVTVTPNVVGAQGCTPGYWKTHLTGALATTTVGSIFSGLPSSFANETLIDALQGGGGAGISGALEILLRAGTAAYLNSINANVKYAYTTAQVVSMVDGAIASNDRATILSVATLLDGANNGTGGCPLS